MAASAVHPLMFWVLTALALAVFAPCVLVPIWEEGQTLREQEQQVAAMVHRLEAVARKNDQRIDALKNDPLVNERLIRRELNYHDDDAHVIHWTPGELAFVRSWVHIPELAEAPYLATGDATACPQPPSSEPMEASVAGSAEGTTGRAMLESLADHLGRWLPAWPWVQLFARSPSRPLLLIMAGSLFAVAFLLYSPRPNRQG